MMTALLLAVHLVGTKPPANYPAPNLFVEVSEPKLKSRDHGVHPNAMVSLRAAIVVVGTAARTTKIASIADSRRCAGVFSAGLVFGCVTAHGSRSRGTRVGLGSGGRVASFA